MGALFEKATSEDLQEAVQVKVTLRPFIVRADHHLQN